MSRKRFVGRFSPGVLLLMLLVSRPVPAQEQDSQAAPDAGGDLTHVSIENLLSMDVTSVSRKEQKLSRAASAIFEDIARSGATNIPDLLRMVPGMDVAQIDANTWAIAARGFNERFGNELQVMLELREQWW